MTPKVSGKDFQINHYDHNGGFFTLNWSTDHDIGDVAVSASEFLEDVYEGELSQENFMADGGYVEQENNGMEITGEQAYGVVSDILGGENPRQSFLSNVVKLSDDEEIVFFRLNTEKAQPDWTEGQRLGVAASYPAGEELAEYALETGNAETDEQTIQELGAVLEAETGDYTTDF
jgi:hypothetical protein